MRGWTLALVLLVGCEGGDGGKDDTDAVDTDAGDTDAVDTDTDARDTDVVDSDTDSAAACDDRTGGALITFDVVGQSFTGWFTSDTFIDTAIDNLANDVDQVPNFLEVLEGTDCDAQWSFHVDPEQVEFADFTIELCDGTPAYVDEHLDDWIATVGQWCPWSAVITAVDDRR